MFCFQTIWTGEYGYDEARANSDDDEDGNDDEFSGEAGNDTLHLVLSQLKLFLILSWIVFLIFLTLLQPSMETGVPGTNGANVCRTAEEQEGKEDQDTASIHPRSTEEGPARGMESRLNAVPQVRVR